MARGIVSNKTAASLAVMAVCATPAVCLAVAPGEAGEMDLSHRMMLLVIQLGLILLAARLGHILFEKIRLPGALGELAAGLVIGPYALGQFAFYGFDYGLFPAAGHGGAVISPELSALSAVAAVVLLFTVGLETDLKLLLRYSLVGGVVGVCGMAASFLLGAAGFMWFSPWLLGHPVGLLAPPCLMLGTVTTATSVAVTARILSEKRKLDSPEGVTILSAAVIDDVLGIILLTVVMGVLTASKATGRIEWSLVGVVAAKAVGVWLGATVIGLIASRKIGVLLKWFGERMSIAIMALAMALLLAGLFEEAGLAMIIGAYVMGLTLSRTDISHVIREKLTPVYALFIPVFFCVTGMRIDLRVLASPPVLVFGAAYAVLALVAKVVGCGLPAMLAGFNLRGAGRIGFGMAPRCEVALIIAGVGLSAGLLGPELLAAVIIMVVVNIVAAPAALAGLFRSPAAGTRRPVPVDTDIAAGRFELATIAMREFFVAKLAGIFESEGFYVHHISRSAGLYQLRKDTTVIDLKSLGTTIEYSCARRDEALVNAAMVEAVAVMEQSIEQLRKPLDARSIQSRLQAPSARGPVVEGIRPYLTVELIEPRLSGRTKTEVIDELLDILVRSGAVKDRDLAHQDVWQREQTLSTGLQHGVAVPHAKTDTVDRLVCAVGISPEGIDFDAMDHEPSTIFILTLSPKDKPAPHVQFMSTISQILNSSGRERVLACETAEQIYAVFTTAPLPERSGG